MSKGEKKKQGELFYSGPTSKSNRIIYTPSTFARTSLLHLQECGQLKAICPHVSSRSSLASYLFFIVTDGSGWLEYDGVRYELSTGDAAIIECRRTYSQSSSEDLWSLKWCHFYGPNAGALYSKYKERGGYNVFRPACADSYRVLLDEIYAAASSDSYTKDMQLNLRITELMTLLMEESWHPEAQMTGGGQQKIDLLEIRDYVDSHYKDPLTLEALARHFFMSKHYLARCFKEQFGTTVTTYIQQVRITRAKELLRFSEDNIQRVSQEIGIEDQNYFSRLFHKFEGTSPGSYRRSWRGERKDRVNTENINTVGENAMSTNMVSADTANTNKVNAIRKEYSRWVEKCADGSSADADLAEELKAMTDAGIEDAFYRDLAFGTGGLRGVIGAGTNRMNVYTVAKASQGLADYVRKNFPEGQRRIAISYDSRIKSDLFAKVAADVFAANEICVFIYRELMPTPCLSYAVRVLGCAAGIMVTASHNPSKYNGYKVYGADGCQITTGAAAEILAEIEKLDIFEDVKWNTHMAEGAPDGWWNTRMAEGVPEGWNTRVAEDAPEGWNSCGTDARSELSLDMEGREGLVSYIPDEVYTGFVEEVKKQSVLYGDAVDRDVSIVYSPLNGTGLKPVLRTLRESGFSNITVVAEQEKPDGSFPTCPYPNPEVKEAMALGMEYARRCHADLLLATDPDCDRVGIAVKNEAGDYELLSGNETGMLLLDFICAQRTRHGKMPEDPVVVKTIVTIDMAERIAAKYGVKTKNVLTGFKFIGEQIGLLEKQGKEDSYILGFEESYGYLSGGYVRDKDAVDGSFLICEMFAWYKTRGVSLLEKLDELYQEYGYCLNTLHSFTFEGSAGFEKMQDIMAKLRGNFSEIGSKKVRKVLDYSQGLDGLPKSDVLKFILDGNCSVVVRPSGTEPKLKAYISISAADKDAAMAAEQSVVDALSLFFL